jgi:hypothetical protein
VSTTPEDTAVSSEQDVLALLNNVKLEESGKGRLSLTTEHLRFERKNGLFSAPRLELSVPLASVSASDVDEASYTLALRWSNDSGAPSSCRFCLPKGDAADHLCQALDYLLDIFQHEARLREERARYQSFLRTTGRNTWLLAGLLSRSIFELTRDGWDAVDANLPEATDAAKELAAGAVVDLTGMLKSLGKTAALRDAALVLPEAQEALEALGKALAGDAPRMHQWANAEEQVTIGLNWRDMRYIFLFSVRYNLLPLWERSGEQCKVDDSLNRLRALSSILAERLGLAVPVEEPPPDDESAAQAVSAVARHRERALETNAETD